MLARNATAVTLLALAALAACAPDSMNNRQAGPFNAFMNTIAKECYPLRLGRYQMSSMILENAIGDTDAYNYFFDQTSRLYYGTLTVPQYASSLNGFFEGSADGAIACIVPKLPQNR